VSDDETEEGRRVRAVLVAARARRRKSEEDREATVGAGGKVVIRPLVKRKSRGPAPEPKARTASTKPASLRSKKIVRKAAPSSPLPVEHSRAAWQDETEELLEAAGVLG
jgi:hypothetical protein